jgi:hypothetical protein
MPFEPHSILDPRRSVGPVVLRNLKIQRREEEILVEWRVLVI